MTSKYFIILEHNLSHFQFIVYMLYLLHPVNLNLALSRRMSTSSNVIKRFEYIYHCMIK